MKNALHPAWEITDDDVATVLAAHSASSGDAAVAAARNLIDEHRVIKAVLCYADFDAQCSASLAEIEDCLIMAAHLPGPKLFPTP